MRIIYMGTPDFAVGPLQSLIDSRHEVVAVFTQPDRPKGRSGELAAPPVKELALKYGIPVYQPEKIRQSEYIDIIRELEPDLIAVAAFGQILPQPVLDAPKYCCLNVHASLLPKYRGAAPIQQAILDGCEETGISIQRMVMALDAGDIVLQEKIRLDGSETGGSLFDTLSQMGGPALLKAIDMVEAGTAEYIPQKGDEASYVKLIKREDGRLDLTLPATVLERRIRGYYPWPGAFARLGAKTLKIYTARVAGQSHSLKPGELFARDGMLYVGCGEGELEITELQIEGKKRMSSQDFLRGHSVEGLGLD
ncbi:MAG: methionyl-tRNA formyltransferase [Lachnospiraceae bacterium]|nr:methionyl-tRNA formyltransferase [Lachnospiraceae bacterium]